MRRFVFTAAPGATVTLSGKTNGFTVVNTAWNTINGFAVTGTSGTRNFGVGLVGHHVVGKSCEFRRAAAVGADEVGDLVSQHDGVCGGRERADHNSYAGIELNAGSTGNEVRGNLTFSNAQQFQRAAPGIRLYQAPGNTVDRNISHDNEDSGIECYTGSNNTLIYGNVSYNNGDHGIDDLSCTGQRIIGEQRLS